MGGKMNRRMYDFRRFLRIAAVFAVFSQLPVMAQFTTASLSGSILDPAGSVIPDAKVTIANVGTGYTQTVNSDGSGAFLFSTLPVGAYRLSVEKAGFSTYVQEGIELTVNQAARQT